MPTVKRELNAENRQFSLTAAAAFSKDGEQETAKRKFSGVAYSGDVISNHWYWGNVVFDIDSTTVPDKLPALIDHDRGMRAGFVTESSKATDGIKMNGILLSNEHGQTVARDSDDGFPWQMSVHIEPGRVEEIQAGKKFSVNGREFTGPMTVFRDSVLREVSFCATGWDSKTSATAMSRPSGGSLPQPLPTTGEFSMTEAEIQAMTAENARLKAESEASANKLKEFAKTARTTAIQGLFSVIGREFKADDPQVTAFAQMDQAGFDATVALLTEQAKAAPKPKTAAEQLAGTAAFSHVAATGGEGAQGTQPAANPLMANAKARADQFATFSKAGSQFAR
jgi:hypothetical protein